jgi:AraC family transcriptional regulator, transcriptional activator of pobA
MQRCFQNEHRSQGLTVHKIIDSFALPEAGKCCYQVFWFKQGAGTLTVDLSTNVISQGTMFSVSPRQICSFDPIEAVTGYLLVVDVEYSKACHQKTFAVFEKLTRSRSPLVVRPKATDQIELEDIFQTMIRELTSCQAFQFDILEGLILVLASYFIEENAFPSESRSACRDTSIFEKFIASLETGFCSRKRVSDYASDLYIGPGYLSETVRRVSGFPASHHIRQRILLEAKRKAITTDASAGEIAYQLGFIDPSTFSKFFKTFSGHTFSDFRACRTAHNSN